MGTVKPVPLMDLEELKKEGHHPKFYVKAVPSSIEGMKTIADFRKKAPKAYEKFDKSIWSFATAEYNIEGEKLRQAKMKAYKIIDDAIPKYPNSSLHFCGSSRNGTGLISADMDLCWGVPVKPEIESDVPYPMRTQGHFNPQVPFTHAYNKLKDLECFDRRPKLVNARVPIIRFTMDLDGILIEGDMNINNTAGIHNTFLLAHYSKIDKRFPALARVLKVWGKKVEIIDSYSGYLNSYTIVLMLIHFLQSGVSPPILPNLNALRPDLFDGNLDLHVLEKSYDLDLNIQMDENDTPIGDLLIGFFRYYGFFYYAREGVYIRTGCIGPKPNNHDEFFLEEVYDRFTVPKNLKKAKMRYLKGTFLDSYGLMFEKPNFEKLMAGERLFMPMVTVKTKK